MARERRGHKGGVRATTLNGAINDAVTTIAGTDLSTWSGTTTNGAATATISRGLSDEETITFTGVSGGNLTGVTRGAGGTTAQAHATGATLEHTSQVTDYSEANELVSLLALNQARVYRTTTQSITNAANIAVLFDAERYDNNSLHSTSSNTSRFTIVTAGKYLVGGSVEFASNATGYRAALITLNNATVLAANSTTAISGDVTRLTVTTVYALAATDFVELWVFQNSGGALNIAAAGNYSPEFWIQAIGQT